MHRQISAPGADWGRRCSARMQAVSLLCASVWLSVPAAQAAETAPLRLTLASAVSKALAGGAAARIARLEAHRAEQSYGALRSGYLPRLAVTSEAGWSNRFDETFTALDQNLVPKKYGLATIGADRGWFNVYLSQVLFDLQQWKLIEREQLAAEAAAIKERRQRDDVAYEVMQRYAALLRAQEDARQAQERLVDAEWLLEQADARLQAGRTLEVEHSLADLHREDAQLDVQVAAHQTAATEADLWIAVGNGSEVGSSLDLVSESLPPVEQPLSLGQVAEFVSGAPELELLELGRRMQRTAVEAARAERLPKLKLVTGYSYYGAKRFDNYNDELWVGIDLSIPIFDGFRSAHEIRGAEDDAKIANIRYESALETKQARVQELLAQLEAGRQRLAIARRRAGAAAEQERLADLNLRAERGGLSEALAAREALARYQGEATGAYFDQLERWASLQRELGRLSSEILGSATPAAVPPQAPGP